MKNLTRAIIALIAAMLLSASLARASITSSTTDHRSVSVMPGDDDEGQTQF